MLGNRESYTPKAQRLLGGRVPWVLTSSSPATKSCQEKLGTRQTIPYSQPLHCPIGLSPETGSTVYQKLRHRRLMCKPFHGRSLLAQMLYIGQRHLNLACILNLNFCTRTKHSGNVLNISVMFMQYKKNFLFYID